MNVFTFTRLAPLSKQFGNMLIIITRSIRNVKLRPLNPMTPYLSSKAILILLSIYTRLSTHTEFTAPYHMICSHTKFFYET